MMELQADKSSRKQPLPKKVKSSSKSKSKNRNGDGIGTNGSVFDEDNDPTDEYL